MNYKLTSRQHKCQYIVDNSISGEPQNTYSGIRYPQQPPESVKLFSIGLVSMLFLPAIAIQQLGSAQQNNVTVRDCVDCPPMVKVPRTDGALSDLYIARHELTWKEYIAAVREDKCSLPRRVFFNEGNVSLGIIEDNYPVAGIAPNEITCYINWISRKTGKRYRLPTGAEWTYAARANVTTRFPWGEALEFGKAAVLSYFDSNKLSLRYYGPRGRHYLQGLAPVESFEPNAWGLYDVVGNLAEYVAEQKPPPSICLKVETAEYCRLQATRGGGTNIYSIGAGGRPILQSNPLDDDIYRSAGYDHLAGYRLVRN